MKNFILNTMLLVVIFVTGFFHNQEAYASDKIERYVRLTQANPLFAWPGVNLDHMEKTVSILEQSRAEIVNLVGAQYTGLQRDRVANTLYPTEYLSQMIALETLRRTLYQHRTLTDLQTYQAQLVRTIGSYQSYLNILIPALIQTAREQNYKGLEYHLGRSSFKYFLSGIRGYRAQADRALELSQQRWACLTDDSAVCMDANWPIAPKPDKVEIDETVFSGVAATMVATMRAKSKTGGRAVHPKWAVTQNHQCFPFQSHVYYFLWEFPSGSDVPIWRADVINDVLVHDHRATKSRVSAYERKLDALGAKGYLHQTMTNHYACPDIGSDTALIRSMVFVYQTLEGINWDKFQLAAHSDLLQLRILAKRVIETPYVNELSVQGFMRELGFVLNTYDKSQLIALWGDDIQGVFEKLMLTYRLKTPNLSRDMMNVIYNNIAIGDYVAHAPWGFLEELLFTRNAPELFLGGSNPSIIYENFPQVEHPRKEISPRLKSYKNDLVKEYTPEEFTEILIKGANAEYDMSVLQERSYLQNVLSIKSTPTSD